MSVTYSRIRDVTYNKHSMCVVDNSYLLEDFEKNMPAAYSHTLYVTCNKCDLSVVDNSYVSRSKKKKQMGNVTFSDSYVLGQSWVHSLNCSVRWNLQETVYI